MSFELEHLGARLLRPLVSSLQEASRQLGLAFEPEEDAFDEAAEPDEHGVPAVPAASARPGAAPYLAAPSAATHAGTAVPIHAVPATAAPSSAIDTPTSTVPASTSEAGMHHRTQAPAVAAPTRGAQVAVHIDARGRVTPLAPQLLAAAVQTSAAPGIVSHGAQGGDAAPALIPAAGIKLAFRDGESAPVEALGGGDATLGLPLVPASVTQAQAPEFQAPNAGKPAVQSSTIPFLPTDRILPPGRRHALEPVHGVAAAVEHTQFLQPASSTALAQAMRAAGRAELPGVWLPRKPEPVAAAAAMPTTAETTLSRGAEQTLRRVGRAVEPMLDRAYGLTMAELDVGEARGAASSDEQPAEPAARVNNHFNVNVAVGGGTPQLADDPEALREALAEWLRDAARRQGLDV